jgi:hypothetical protein
MSKKPSGYDDFIERVRRRHDKFYAPLAEDVPSSKGAPASGARPIDKDLLWKEYDLHIDLYKEYMKITATFNAFFYGVTGAVLSYCLSAENDNEVRWALFFPPLMCVFFAYVFFNSWWSFRKVEDEIACIAYAFGFERPEVNTLTKILMSSWIMYIATLCGLVFVIYKAPPWA